MPASTPTVTRKRSGYSFSDPKVKKAWNFVWLNVLSVLGTLALFFGILYGDFLTSGFDHAWTWLQRHEVIMALAASTPFFAALLVGRASSAKAKRKRMAAAKLRATEEIKAAREKRHAESGAI